MLKRKHLRLPDGLLTKVYKDIVNGYHNENCWILVEIWKQLRIK